MRRRIPDVDPADVPDVVPDPSVMTRPQEHPGPALTIIATLCVIIPILVIGW